MGVSLSGDILMLGTVHGIGPVSVCLQILKSFNISGMMKLRSSNLAGFTQG